MVNVIWRAALTAAAAALLGGGAPAPDEGLVCIGGPQWRPTIEETRAIATVPVPARYDRMLQEPCAERSSNDQLLVSWHLRFGTERSTAEALSHLEEVYRRTLPPASAYVAQLRSAWTRAQPDLARAREIRQPAGAAYSAQWRFIEASPPIARLSKLASARDAFQRLAVLHQRAAERFSSTRLLDKAEAYSRPVVAAGAFLGPLDREKAPSNLLYFNLQTFRSDDLRMRVAVLRAQLSRSPADLAAAEALLQSLEDPHFRAIGREAYSGGDDFCDIGDAGPGNSEEIREACGRDDMHERVVAYWLNRAALDLVADRPSDASHDARDVALRLLERERRSSSGRCCYRSSAEDLFRLRLLIAAHERRMMEAVPSRGGNEDRQSHLWDALGALRDAEALARPAEDPVGFRQSATAWLALWKRRAEVFRSDGLEEPLVDSPNDRRYAAYLQGVLRNLDSIVAGDEAREGRRTGAL